MLHLPKHYTQYTITLQNIPVRTARLHINCDHLVVAPLNKHSKQYAPCTVTVLFTNKRGSWVLASNAITHCGREVYLHPKALRACVRVLPKLEPKQVVPVSFAASW